MRRTFWSTMDLATGVYIQNWSQKSLQVAAQRQASILWENARTLVMNKTKEFAQAIPRSNSSFNVARTFRAWCSVEALKPYFMCASLQILHMTGSNMLVLFRQGFSNSKQSGDVYYQLQFLSFVNNKHSWRADASRELVQCPWRGLKTGVLMCFLPWQCYKNNLLLRCPNPRMYPISSLIVQLMNLGIRTNNIHIDSMCMWF